VQDALFRSVTRDYLTTIGAVMKEGRPFTGADHAASTPVVIINAHFARMHWGERSPLGEQIRFGGNRNRAFTVVGVVNDIRERGLDVPMKPGAYVMIEQGNGGPVVFLALRTVTEPTELGKAASEAVWSVDRDQPIAALGTMAGLVDAQLGSRDLQRTLLAIFAALALFLAALGIYGVLSYLVTQRAREIGLRKLGAEAGQVARMFVAQGLGLTLAGVLAGLVVSVPVGLLMRSMLYGMAPGDLRIYVAVGALLSVVAALACYVPARRSSRLDPMESLRDQ
jgi:hypothetical protein